jgi:hypothetical protein
MRLPLGNAGDGTQKPVDGRGHPLPRFGFFGEPFSAGRRNGVKFRPASLIRRAPFRYDPFFLLHPQERRIKRALVEPQKLSADLLDSAREP